MLPVLHIGPVSLQTPGLLILLGVWLGLSLSDRLSPRYQVDPNSLYNLVFIALIAGIVGARLLFAIQHFEIFINSPLNLFSFNPGMLDPVSGITVGILAAFIYGNRKQLSFWATLDGLTPLLAVLTIFFALSHLASGDAFGIKTRLPWGIFLWGEKRHPTQIYMAIVSALILGFIWLKQENTNIKTKHSGLTFLTFTAMSAGKHLFLDTFRNDSSIFILNLRTTQLVAWMILALSFWGIRNILSSNNKWSKGLFPQ